MSRSRHSITVLIFLFSVTVPVLAVAEKAKDESTAIEFFEKKIRPLFVENCHNCHSADTNAKGGLRVDDRNGLIHGGNKGAAVVPGQPDKSLLFKKVTLENPKQRMPPDKQLSEEQIADLRKWIEDGAVWPAEKLLEGLQENAEHYEKLRKSHWAWQPLKKADVPAVKDGSWARDAVDRFVLSKLEEKNLKPNADADKITLLRRITFDLTGLPPSSAEIESFAADQSPGVFEKVVDRLLGSRAFGERWGRHWLDVARYAESTGSSRNVPYQFAWRYRDYVIDAFNNDKPYDQFIREQIAGDLLPSDSKEQHDEQLIATGFLALGVKDVNQRFKIRFTMDNIDEQIDTVSRSVLGLTVSCARCHDHKFDPIPRTDYYALAGIFHSTDLCAGVRNKMGGNGLDYFDPTMLLRVGEEPRKKEISAEQQAKIDKAKELADAAREDFEAIRGTPEGLKQGPNGRPRQFQFRQRMNRAVAEYQSLLDPTANENGAFGVRDAKVIGDTEIRIRGEAEKLGPIVPRGNISLFTVADAPKINEKQSGRLELAQWLTSKENALAARVITNRIWQHLFGQGIVTSVDNFGVTGDVPSHPELLDYLAERFVREGWSVKKLVRALVLTRAYQLSSESALANVAVDPANRLVWRHTPRRLDAEEIRDTVLLAAGQLDQTPAKGSIARELRVAEMRNNGAEARRIEDEIRIDKHRSVYLPLLRGLVPHSLEVFDFAEQGMVTGSRDTTTVATQSLYLVNDAFVRRNSLTLAEQILDSNASDEESRIQKAYQVINGRVASPIEISRAKKFIVDYESLAHEAAANAPIVKSKQAAETTIVKNKPKPETSSGKNGKFGNGKKKNGGGKKKKKFEEAAPENSVEDKVTAEPKPEKQNDLVVNNKPEGLIAYEEGNGEKQPAKPSEPVNADEADQSDAPIVEEDIRPRDAKAAAWASFCQALFGSAEFRYLK